MISLNPSCGNYSVLIVAMYQCERATARWLLLAQTRPEVRSSSGRGRGRRESNLHGTSSFPEQCASRALPFLSSPRRRVFPSRISRVSPGWTRNGIAESSMRSRVYVHVREYTLTCDVRDACSCRRSFAIVLLELFRQRCAVITRPPTAALNRMYVCLFVCCPANYMTDASGQLVDGRETLPRFWFRSKLRFTWRWNYTALLWREVIL